MPNILIVDDEPLQRLLVREILNEDPALRFFESAGGAQALRLIQRYRPHTIILGLRAPDLDKVHRYERLRAVPGGRPTTLIVNTAGPRTHPNFKMLVASGYPILVRPFEPEELQIAVRLALLRVPSAV